jgi:hypothetical protein
VTARTNANAGRGSPLELARIERNMIPFDALVPESAEPASATQSLADVLQAAVDAEQHRQNTAMANVNEIAAELHRLADRLDAGTVDTAAPADDLRVLATWLFAEAEEATDDRH